MEMGGAVAATFADKLQEEEKRLSILNGLTKAPVATCIADT